MLRYQKWITRRELADNPGTLYVFGDNLARYGMGGQAGECRGMRNAVGVPTKRLPGRQECDYFTDADFEEWHAAAMPKLAQLAEHLRAGGTVVWPSDGIGTGLAELPKRAPRIWACLERARRRLDEVSVEVQASLSPPLPPEPTRPADAPLVRKVLDTWPGAQIVDVREPEPEPELQA